MNKKRRKIEKKSFYEIFWTLDHYWIRNKEEKKAEINLITITIYQLNDGFETRKRKLKHLNKLISDQRSIQEKPFSVNLFDTECASMRDLIWRKKNMFSEINYWSEHSSTLIVRYGQLTSFVNIWQKTSNAKCSKKFSLGSVGLGRKRFNSQQSHYIFTSFRFLNKKKEITSKQIGITM